MSSPQAEIDLDQWVEYCDSLSPIQNFLLIGSLSRRGSTVISILQTEPLETEENWEATEKWALENLRKALKIYCDNYKKRQVEIGIQAGKTLTEALKDMVKIVAPNLAYQLGGSKAVAVAFMFWLLKYALDKWCDKYADKQLSGSGIYSRFVPPKRRGGKQLSYWANSIWYFEPTPLRTSSNSRTSALYDS